MRSWCRCPWRRYWRLTAAGAAQTPRRGSARSAHASCTPVGRPCSWACCCSPRCRCSTWGADPPRRTQLSSCPAGQWWSPGSVWVSAGIQWAGYLPLHNYLQMSKATKSSFWHILMWYVMLSIRLSVAVQGRYIENVTQVVCLVSQVIDDKKGLGDGFNLVGGCH